LILEGGEERPECKAWTEQSIYWHRMEEKGRGGGGPYANKIIQGKGRERGGKEGPRKKGIFAGSREKKKGGGGDTYSSFALKGPRKRGCKKGGP